jgi:hypothetical protein
MGSAPDPLCNRHEFRLMLVVVIPADRFAK